MQLKRRILCVGIWGGVISSIMTGGISQIYSWTDEDGKVYYTDTPPSSDHQMEADKEMLPTGDVSYRHYLFKEKNRGYYCGDRRLQYNNENPQESYLLALEERKGIRSTRTNLKKREASLAKLSGGRKYVMAGSKSLHERMEQLECADGFYRLVVKKYAGYKNIIIRAVDHAQYRFDEITQSCGPAPEPGTYTDKASLDWAKCDMGRVEESNKRLKELKKAKWNETRLRKALSSD